LTQTATLLTHIDATASSLELAETPLAAVGAIAISLKSSFRRFWPDGRFDKSELIIDAV
jgi:hypothetical protein